jgi:hypothetical protein
VRDCARVDSASGAIDLCRRRFRQGSSVVEQPPNSEKLSRAGAFGVGRLREFAKLFTRNKSQGSSVVEQGTHKPLVGSSTLPPGIRIMAWVYILRGSSDRHYIGSAIDLDATWRNTDVDIPTQRDGWVKVSSL